MSEHSIKAAMARGELSEDEAYFVLRIAGHHGYSESIKRLDGPLRRARRWLVWFGGWESPELCQWDLGWPAWRFRDSGGKLNSPTPLSFCGHKVTFQNFSAHMQTRGGYLCVSWDRRQGRKVYWSPDATPSNKDAVFYYGSKR